MITGFSQTGDHCAVRTWLVPPQMQPSSYIHQHCIATPGSLHSLLTSPLVATLFVMIAAVIIFYSGHLNHMFSHHLSLLTWSIIPTVVAFSSCSIQFVILCCSMYHQTSCKDWPSTYFSQYSWWIQKYKILIPGCGSVMGSDSSIHQWQWFKHRWQWSPQAVRKCKILT